MTPNHHLTDDLLVAHAGGTLAAPAALLVATHLTLCPVCRAELRRLEAVGGALLDQLEPAAIGAGALAAVLGRLDEPVPAAIPPPAIPAHAGGPLLPRPLAARLGANVDALPWRRIVRGVAESAIALPESPPRATKTALLRIAPGRAIPRHTHRGTEMLLVLDGSFSDETGHYRRGDVQICDEDLTHRPVADADGECLCLTVTEAPIRLTGPFGRFLNPFLRA